MQIIYTNHIWKDMSKSKSIKYKNKNLSNYQKHDYFIY